MSIDHGPRPDSPWTPSPPRDVATAAHSAARTAAPTAAAQAEAPTRVVLGAWNGPAGDSATGNAMWEQALPASVWHRVLGDVTSTLEIEGGPVTLWGARSGRRRQLATDVVGRHPVRLAAHGPQWLWVEGPVRAVSWSVERTVELPPVTVVMPTMRREQDAIVQAERFARMDCVQDVLVIDQGLTLAQRPEFVDLLAQRPEIRLITQPNLGGSGGYARGMLEAAASPGNAVLFTDDDAVLPAESLRRMVTFQALCTTPTILGTPLFSAAKPDRLIALSEAVRGGDFQWHATDGVRGPVDLAGTTPEQWAFLRRRGEANYTGWWATLFPPGTAADVGLPAPFFLKWDDAEYGLRATTQGYRHQVLPGTSVHHPPWTMYRTQMTWTARVLHRNRLATAAAHGSGRGVILSSLLHQGKHVLAGLHLTAALWDHGIDSFLSGPESWLGRDLARARADGGKVVSDWTEQAGIGHPTTGHSTAGRPTAGRPTEPLAVTRHRPLPLLPALGRAVLRLLLPDRPPRLVMGVREDSLTWRTALGADAIVITDAAHPAAATYPVRGSTGRRLLRGTLGRHLRMALRWRGLQRRYRRALPRTTTTRAWSQLFDLPAPTRSPREGSRPCHLERTP